MDQELARVYRASCGKILAHLIKQCADVQLAEDALHDACEQAQQSWRQAMPESPASWLYTVASRRLIDKLRTSSRKNEGVVKEQVLAALSSKHSDEAAQEIPDERLSLIFTCCHPALNTDAQVALTLKTLCGLTVKEIARAFLVSETTMAQRLVRAKTKIKLNAIPYQVPSKQDLDIRLDAVLAVIYLIYNESYTAFEGQTLTRDDLAQEAIRLASLLTDLLYAPESFGLLALMLFHQSRRPARLAQDGSLVALEQQNRNKWDQSLIQRATHLLTKTLKQGKAGNYQLQAAISAVHAESKSWCDTDWPQIIGLYRELNKRFPSAVAELNLYVAVAHSGEPALAKRGMSGLQQKLANYQPFYAGLAEVESLLGNHQVALGHYERAIELTQNQPEKLFLKGRRQQLALLVAEN